MTANGTLEVRARITHVSGAAPVAGGGNRLRGGHRPRSATVARLPQLDTPAYGRFREKCVFACLPHMSRYMVILCMLPHMLRYMVISRMVFYMFMLRMLPAYIFIFRPTPPLCDWNAKCILIHGDRLWLTANQLGSIWCRNRWPHSPSHWTESAV